MENIHLIPTDKYSDLVHSTNRYGGLFLSRHYSPMKDMGDSYQHIYITNDEEIKEGDLICRTKHPTLIRAEGNWNNTLDLGYRKIILTTDPKLIANGIQAIDDEFLEWFVNNSSCEKVEIERVVVYDDNNYRSGEVFHSNKKLEYKIIFPKEEPKQENCCTPIGKIKRYVDCKGCDRKTKQETLEEVAEKYANELPEPYNYGINPDKKKGFIEGAKWQQERSYSEEDMIEFAKFMYLEVGLNSGKDRTNKELFKEWVIQNKKK